MQINTVNEVNLDITDRNVDAVFSEAFCVRGNESGRYRVIAYGASDGQSAFLLSSDNGNELAYQVAYRGNSGDTPGTDYDDLRPGVPSPEYQVTSRTIPCDSATAFRVTFSSQDLVAAQSGFYRGSLTFMVSPV